MWNDGTGHFRSRPCGPAFEHDFVGRGSAVADYDNDGDPDIAVSNSAGPLQLLRNDGEHGHWLGVELVGRKSNRQGIGARLVAETPGGKEAHALRRGGLELPLVLGSARALRAGGGDVGPDADDLLAVGQACRSSRTWPAGKYVKIEEK